MNLDIFNGVTGLIGKVADKLWPDPLERAKQQLRLLELEQAGEFKHLDAQLQSMQMQADVNKVEASHASVFVSGWRPFIGWVCGAALAYQFIGVNLIVWVCRLNHIDLPPEMDMGDLITVLLGMLGIGGMRTYEKIRGVAK